MNNFNSWEEFEPEYAKTLASQDKGLPAMSVRVALGTLIIKERLGTSDEETVEQISENPYLQYFLGFKSFKLERPFDPSITRGHGLKHWYEGREYYAVVP